MVETYYWVILRQTEKEIIMNKKQMIIVNLTWLFRTLELQVLCGVHFQRHFQNTGTIMVSFSETLFQMNSY